MVLPVITYHALSDMPAPLGTPPQVFEQHLKAFRHWGYRTVSLAEVSLALTHDQPLPERSLVISFDDGYQSIYREAWPRLRDWGFTATVYLISDWCGRDNRWLGQPPTLPTAPLMTWDEAAQLAAAGWELGAHTCSHRPLPGLAPAAVETELSEAQRTIQIRTGQSVQTFAYPYGAVSPEVKTLVQRYFVGAAGTRLGLVDASGDPYDLKRIDAYYLRPSMIRYLDQPLFDQYLHFRQRLRDLRRHAFTDWQI
ncbi:polysaccharide deacetylase family protein [Anthocerotibacter panamensis]|uniref:polysaccharide deacetylase family protein n=1 Tax=Anthocerotibacter panamensis TaxID=2857077 RepID=UPI001C401BD3|nr:polysaccharide deacetylase family protein [Anthocerotibacter panamensis]